MKFERLIMPLLFICFFTPSIHYANDNDLDVTAWSQQTLLATLSINYNETDTDFADLRKRYTLNAWSALHNFFSQQITEVKKKQLTIHPYPLTKPSITEQGVFSGIYYWRVNQSFMIPELHSQLDFSVIIIKGNNPPFMVQSVNIVRH
ncbi:DotI/IcmL family type IV secretion protein [Legionella hackeliae]|uniref:Uncharacterized protein n=1 Tax=Legionella hackeliae TaxID=449 RepID=A0A0A8UQZ2_LEGHA|nr:DotI/IcmL family type IV secretion protein [Legionella hackeliae]KTD14862.1 Macrophage killing protein with similarity to conjugation protein [Legionella hackeliae]CEK09512.1 conserved protein of unknown function [Legionella hackeliae]STX49419.1 Macrophage killing protein with similarity to conjugation protein [Legionella hackeliae]